MIALPSEEACAYTQVYTHTHTHPASSDINKQNSTFPLCSYITDSVPILSRPCGEITVTSPNSTKPWCRSGYYPPVSPWLMWERECFCEWVFAALVPLRWWWIQLHISLICEPQQKQKNPNCFRSAMASVTLLVVTSWEMPLFFTKATCVRRFLSSSSQQYPVFAPSLQRPQSFHSHRISTILWSYQLSSESSYSHPEMKAV